ncbi:MAG TPA: uroporphyrinogen decarboxylase [Firmicutes bacterium]|jgi:uroporphyrinogen decarboxylase|nr:uroporphyrinogen decarboxylase [Bacillota bacterium]
MSHWTKKQRFLAVVSGESADRVPVSAWRHFIEQEQTATGLAEAMIEFQKQYDWDFVKINPRATYYAEAWGNTYDYRQYDGVVPRVNNFVIGNPEDLFSVGKLPGNQGPFGEQLEVIRTVRKSLGDDVPILQTLFSPLAVFEYLAGHRTLAGNREANRCETPLPGFFAASAAGTHQALENISNTLTDYAKAAIQAGADGFFYAELGLAREGYLTETEFKEFGRAYDLQLLEELNQVPIVLHICGPYAHPERFYDYPIQAIHWAEHAPGNPSLEESGSWIGDKAVMGGVDEMLFALKDPNKVFIEANQAIDRMSHRAFLLAPGCGVPLNSTPSALLALRQAVKE